MSPLRAGLGLWLAGCSPEPPSPPPPPLPNVVVVVMDTVRWDHTSLAGYVHDTTPMLATLAEMPGAISFARAYTPGSWSGPAYASLFTGRDALSHGVGFTRAAYLPEHVTLAELLSAYGYQTAGFGSGPHLLPRLGSAQGFDAFLHTPSSRSLAPQVDAALDWLDARTAGDQRRPFFLFVQGYDAHFPYPAPALMAGMFDPAPEQSSSHRCTPGRQGADWRCAQTQMEATQLARSPDMRAHVIGHYDAAIRYADYQLGRLLQGLDDRDLLQDSLIIALSDHGEDLEGARAFSHDWSCGEAVFHVPLVLRLPGSTADPVRWEGLVSTADLLPTVADQIHAVPPAGITGQALLPLPAGAVPERLVTGASMMCYRVQDDAWVLRGDREGELGALRWSLHAGSDDGPDVLAEHPQEADRLRTAIADWPEQLDMVQVNMDPARRDPVLQKALQEGGYWQRMEEQHQR